MNISQKGIDLIKKYEGLRLNAYKPVPTERYFTIGYGHYGKDVSPNMTITQAEAEAMLKKDLEKFEAKVNKYSKYNWTQNEFDALVSFAYNIGSIDQLTQNGKRTKEEIADKILSYDKAGGKKLAGLTKRRLEEKMMFLNVPVVNTYTVKPASTVPSSKPTLKLWSKGEDVKFMQTKLNEVGGYQLKIDGIFGVNTYNAVIGFQAQKGLKKDGICGPKTWEALLS